MATSSSSSTIAPHAPPPPPPPPSTLFAVTAGAIAGMANIVAGFPFDTVKVRLQSKPGVYKSPYDCFSRTWRDEGFRSLFRGMSPSLAGGAVETAINYGVYVKTLDFLERVRSIDPVGNLSIDGMKRLASSDASSDPIPPPLQSLQATSPEPIHDPTPPSSLAARYRHIFRLAPSAPHHHHHTPCPPSQPPATCPPPPTPAPPPPLVDVCIAAAVSGACLSTALSPFELVKCRLQCAPPSFYRGPWDCARQLLRTEGIKGLTRGLSLTATREIFGNVIYFGVYEHLRRELFHVSANRESSNNDSSSGNGGGGEKKRSFRVVLHDLATATLAGGLAGMAVWVVLLPVDTLKTVQQISQPGTADLGVRGHLRRILLTKGWRGLYSGFVPVMVRAFPANAAQWVSWELANTYMSPS